MRDAELDDEITELQERYKNLLKYRLFDYFGGFEDEKEEVEE